MVQSRMERCSDGMSALRVVTVAETENCLNQGKRYLQAWKTIWPFLQSSWGWGGFVRAACVPTRVSCCALLNVQSHSGAGPRESLHCPSHSVVVIPVPPGPCAGGSDSPEGPWGQNSGPGMPNLSFCKSKATLCPNDRPQQPLPHHLFQSSLRNTLLPPGCLGSSEMLLGLLLLYSSMASW